MKFWMLALVGVAIFAAPFAIAEDKDESVDACKTFLKADNFEKFEAALHHKMYDVKSGKHRVPGIMAHTIAPCASNWEEGILHGAALKKPECGVKIVFENDSKALTALATLKALGGKKGLWVEAAGAVLPLCAGEVGKGAEVALAPVKRGGPEAAMAFGLASFPRDDVFTEFAPPLQIQAPFMTVLTVPGFPRPMKEVQIVQQELFPGRKCQIDGVRVQSTRIGLKPTERVRGSDDTWSINGGAGANVTAVNIVVSGTCLLQVLSHN